MAEASDPVLFTKRASRGTGSNAVDGVCMISKAKVRWEPSDPSKAQPAVIEISAVTRTQQAPAKPFLKLETATGPLILGFGSLTDRNDAVDLLKQVTPAAAARAAGGASPGAGGPQAALPTAEQAAALFRADPDLGSVYKSLVVAGILGEQEFWRTRQAQVRDALARLANGGAPPPAACQRPGLPSAMLANVKPSADGQTEKVHFQLTPQIIQQIFVEKPEVHRAYLARVPHSMDEKTFWTRYFKQQYKRMAQRRRQGLAADDDDEEDELFAPFRKQLQEQEAARAKQAMARVDPTVNLAADAGERFTGGFGSLRDGASESAGALRRTARDTLSREINRHAAVVLAGAPEPAEGLQPVGGAGGEQATAQDAGRIAAALAAQQTAAAARASKAAAATEDGDGGVSPERLREWQERAASALEDLALDDRDKQFAPLNIQDPRAYFGGTAANGKQQQQQQQGDGTAAQAAAPGAALLAALAAVQPLALPDPPCDPAAAASVLLALSQEHDEQLVREFGAVAAAALRFPPHDPTHGVQPLLLEHLRAEALKTNELLRHFWGCMPLVSAAKAERAARLARHLRDQQALLSSHMGHHAGTSQQVYVVMMLRPLAAAIEAALERHAKELEQRQRLAQKLQAQPG